MEDFRKFTDQKDPTKILDLSSISLEDQYTKLTDEQVEYIIEKCNAMLPGRVEKGIFGADMKVELLNDGPFTIVLDSDQLFITRK